MYNVTSENTDGKITTKPFNTKTFDVFGGKIKIRKAIQAKTDEVERMFEETYEVELKGLKASQIQKIIKQLEEN